MNCYHSCSWSILLINIRLCLSRQRPLKWTVSPLGGRPRMCCIIDAKPTKGWNVSIRSCLFWTCYFLDRRLRKSADQIRYDAWTNPSAIFMSVYKLVSMLQVMANFGRAQDCVCKKRHCVCRLQRLHGASALILIRSHACQISLDHQHRLNWYPVA